MTGQDVFDIIKDLSDNVKYFAYDKIEMIIFKNLTNFFNLFFLFKK